MQGARGRQRFAIDSVCDEDGTVVDVGCDFAQRVDDFISVGADGDEVNAEVFAAGFVWNADAREQVNERNTGE